MSTTDEPEMPMTVGEETLIAFPRRSVILVEITGSETLNSVKLSKPVGSVKHGCTSRDSASAQHAGSELHFLRAPNAA